MAENPDLNNEPIPSSKKRKVVPPPVEPVNPAVSAEPLPLPEITPSDGDPGTQNATEEDSAQELVTEGPGFIYLSRSDIVNIQIDEAETHQKRVDSGTCWQDDYFGHQMLEPSIVSCAAHPSSLPDEVQDLLTWTSHQKMTFIELIGRRTAANLPEIAEIVGKSSIECQEYLEMLQEGAEHLAIDYAEIPAAEEVPMHLIEPSLDATYTPLRRNESEGENDSKLFVLRRLNALAGKNASPETLHHMREALRAKVTEWIRKIESHRMGPASSITEETVRQVLSLDSTSNASADVAPQVGDENLEKETIEEVAADEALADLAKQEELWLEQLDKINSQLCLRARGLVPGIATSYSLTDRSEDLEKFMQSRA